MKTGSLFNRHPAAVGQTYWQHCATAFGYAFALGRAAVAVALHALLPFLFETAASTIVDRVHRQMDRSRRKGA